MAWKNVNCEKDCGSVLLFKTGMSVATMKRPKLTKVYRLLSVNLGRPILIAAEYIQAELPLDPHDSNHSPISNPDILGSFTYYRHILYAEPKVA